MEKLGTKSQFLLCALYQKKSTVLNRRQRLPPKGNEKKWQDDATVAENSKKKIIMETSQSKASFFLFCFFLGVSSAFLAKQLNYVLTLYGANNIRGMQLSLGFNHKCP
jgi:hypothetical protein